MASQPDAIINLAISNPEKAPHILQGLSEGFKGWRKAPLPKNWPAATSTLSEKNPDLIRELSALFGDGRALDSLRKIALDNNAGFATRQTALQGLIDARPDDLRALCEKLLRVRYLNKTAIHGLATFPDPAIADLLLKRYPGLRPDEKQTVIDTLVTRPGWTSTLLKRISENKIPRSAITPFHASQIIAQNDPVLTKELQTAWGDLRQIDAAKKKRIAQLTANLHPEARDAADLSAGRVHFQNLCASCHLLYGQGGKLGPDLTGSGRADLSYLLENIIDPSAIVPAEYRMTILKLTDGRTLTGVIARSTEKTITLRSLAHETTLEKTAIKETTILEKSIMPEGLLQTLTPEQTRDFISYLMHPQQVPLAK